MRVLLYLPTPGGLTGAPRRLLTLALGLRDLGATPIIATEPGTPLMAAAREAGVETVSLVPVGVLARRDGALFGGGLVFRLRVAATLLHQQLRFWSAVRESSADIVWTRSGKGLAFSMFGVILSRRPLVWDVVNEMYARGVMRLLLVTGLMVARRVVLQHAGVREVFGERLAARHGSRIRVLTPGIDVAMLRAKRKRGRTKQRAGESRFRILQVGTICDNKNQSFLIEAVRHLPPDLRDRVEICFVGGTHSAAYEQELRAAVQRHGMANMVTFLGWRDDVHDLMLDCDLLAMPSKSEGVPNAVQEAMALGLPVLGSDRGGIPEVLDHEKTGWVLPIDDPARWAETIGRLINAPETLARVGESARIHAETHFANDAWCARYLHVFEEAVASRKGRGSV